MNGKFVLIIVCLSVDLLLFGARAACRQLLPRAAMITPLPAARFVPTTLALLLMLNEACNVRAATGWRNRTPPGDAYAELPSPRANHLFLAGEEGYALLHSGCSSPCCTMLFADSWSFAPPARWQPLPPVGDAPAGLFGHRGVAIGETPGAFLIYGGAAGAGKETSQLWRVDISAGVANWSAPVLRAGGMQPAPRQGHVMVAVPEDATFPPRRGTAATTATTAAGGAAPAPPRAPHYDGTFIMYGGHTRNEVHNDVWVYQARVGMWRQLHSGDPHHKQNGAPLPDPRSGHTAALRIDSHGAASLIVYGGVDDFGTPLGDVWAFHCQSSSWQLLEPSPQPALRTLYSLPGAAHGPAERHKHIMWLDPSAASSSSSSDAIRLLLFSGQHGVLPSDAVLGDTWALTVRNEADTDRSSEHTEGVAVLFQRLPYTVVPPPRFGAAAVLMHTSSGSGSGHASLFVFGGAADAACGDNATVYGDLWQWSSE